RLALARLDRTRRADAFGRQPSLVITSVRIDQAMGTLEIDRQPPALAGLYRRAAMPGQTQPAGQRAAPGNRVAQFETHHAIPVFRQPDHLSFQPQGAAIESGRQAVIERPLRRPAGPYQAKAEQPQRITAKG